MAAKTRFTEFVTPERTLRLFTGPTIKYLISLDPERVDFLVRKALGNKSRRAIAGPVKVEITETLDASR